MTRDSATARQVYRGVWAVLARVFKVPEQAPTLRALSGESVDSFRPAQGFLDYLKFKFWIVLLLSDAALFVLWVILLVRAPGPAILLIPVFLVLIVLPDLVAYVALHLRYDTTWYVMSDRSLRIRRGIWVIRETTVTFENVQNVELSQGPLQRYFGIAELVVQTAGGGGGSAQQKGQQSNPHVGKLEGLADADRIRDLIMQRVRRSRRAGLGDEHGADDAVAAARWTAAHVEALRAIRDEVLALRGGRKPATGP